MAVPAFNMRQLLEAGVHFGHQSHRWNPKMAPFIYGARNNIHIVDLTQTTPMLHQALTKVSDTVANGGRVLFVATKRAASDSIAEAAKRSAQYYMNHRWLGGTLTNWKTISASIRRLRQLDDILADPQGRPKKEVLQIQRERDKLNQSLGGIKDMGGTPDLLFVIDTNKESIAIQEARKLGIPIVAIVDTNCDLTASTSRSQVTTTPVARLPCTATSSLVPPSTASPARSRAAALTSARWKTPSVKNSPVPTPSHASRSRASTLLAAKPTT